MIIIIVVSLNFSQTKNFKTAIKNSKPHSFEDLPIQQYKSV